MKGVSIYLSADLEKELKRHAKKENRSLSKFIELLLNKCMRSRR